MNGLCNFSLKQSPVVVIPALLRRPSSPIKDTGDSSQLRGTRNLSSMFGVSKSFLSLPVCLIAIGLASCVQNSAVTPAQSTRGSGDSMRGEELFQKRCGSCHSLDKEKEGPRLGGVFGRKAASVSSFRYSDAMKASNFTWDGDALEKWLSDTDRFVPNNDMNWSFKKCKRTR